MNLKIKSNDNESLTRLVDRIMDLLRVIITKGVIPTEEDIQNAEKEGNYWLENKEGIKLDPKGNNYNLWYKEITSTYVVLSFTFRYDKDNMKVNAIFNLLTAFFNKTEIELVDE